MAKYQPKVELVSLPNKSYRLKITLHGHRPYMLRGIQVHPKSKKGRKVIPSVVEYWLTPFTGAARSFEFQLPWEKGDDPQIGIKVIEVLEEEALDTIVNIPPPSTSNGKGINTKVEGQMKEKNSPAKDISVIRFTDSLD